MKTRESLDVQGIANPAYTKVIRLCLKWEERWKQILETVPGPLHKGAMNVPTFMQMIMYMHTHTYTINTYIQNKKNNTLWEISHTPWIDKILCFYVSFKINLIKIQKP